MVLRQKIEKSKKYLKVLQQVKFLAQSFFQNVKFKTNCFCYSLVVFTHASLIKFNSKLFESSWTSLDYFHEFKLQIIFGFCFSCICRSIEVRSSLDHQNRSCNKPPQNQSPTKSEKFLLAKKLLEITTKCKYFFIKKISAKKFWKIKFVSFLRPGTIWPVWENFTGDGILFLFLKNIFANLLCLILSQTFDRIRYFI